MARILFGHEAAEALLAGIAATTRAIAASLGPTGRAVLVHEPPAPPELLSDGYAIARVLADRPGPAAAGARLLKESLFHLDRDLGDGTATAAILMHRLVRDGFRL
ncbi:MAG: hypothetical protein IRY94_15410, partial [Rhodospirillaceae bacterium]|nr:hypothetical protein [Rhodospirillaceae bacterium]